MPWYKPILLWIATVLIGSPVFALIIDLGEPEGVLAVAAVAAVCGAPALVLFILGNALGPRLVGGPLVSRTKGMLAYLVIAAFDVLIMCGVGTYMGEGASMVLLAAAIYGPLGAIIWWLAWPKHARAEHRDLSSLLDQL